MTARLALGKLSENQLIVLARQQYPHACDAYEELMKRYEKKLTLFCINTCGNQADAEDAMQHVLLKVYNSLSKFRGESALSTWLYRIAYNECISLLRKRKTGEDVDEVQGERLTYRDPEPADQSARFNALMAFLPERERSVVVLRLVAEFEFKDIAAITGDGLSAIKMRYKRALEKLRVQMDKTYDGNG